MCFDPFGSGCSAYKSRSNCDRTSCGVVLPLAVGFVVVQYLGLVWGAYRKLGV